MFPYKDSGPKEKCTPYVDEKGSSSNRLNDPAVLQNMGFGSTEQSEEYVGHLTTLMQLMSHKILYNER